MKIFISQPMRGFSEEEILKERKRICDIFYGNRFVNPCNPKNKEESNLVNLGESIVAMAEADIVVAPRNCWDYNGCYIEQEVAHRYNIPVCLMEMYPDHHRDLNSECMGVTPNA